MYVIFLAPLAMSIVAGLFVVFGDYGWPVKLLVVGLVAASAACQFVPVLQDNVHFLIPLFTQILIGGGYFLWLQRSTYI